MSGIVDDVIWWDTDGEGPEPEWLIVGGQFAFSGNARTSGYAAWDGDRWRELGSGSAHVSEERAQEFEIFQGRLYVGCLASGGVRSWGPSDGWRTHLYVGAPVNALAVHNGMLFMGTTNTIIINDDGSRFVGALGAWDGQRWSPVGDPPLEADVVYSAHSFDGDLYVGFRREATPTSPVVEGLAKLHAGTWSIDPTIIGRIYSLTVSEGRLYAGGALTNFPDYTAASVAAWDGSAWDVLGGGLNQPVFDLAPYPGGVVAVGEFTETAESDPAPHVAAWFDGAWHALGSGVALRDSFPIPYSVATRGNTVVVGGLFSSAGDVGVANIAMWANDSWNALGSGLSDDVYAILTFRNDLYLGGAFRFGDYGDTSGLAVWDGNRLDRAAPSLDGDVLALAEFRGKLVAGGMFLAAGGTPMSRIAELDSQEWHPLGLGLVGTCRAMVATENELFAAGDLTRAGPLAVRRIARWDGAQWTRLGTGVNGTVRSLTRFGPAIVAAGDFTEAGGMPANRVAFWDGTSWHPMGNGFDNTVFTVAVHDGELYAGGFLGSSGGVYMSQLARWNGEQWVNEGAGLPGRPDILGNLPAVRAIGLMGNRMVVAGTGAPERAAFVAVRDASAWTTLELFTGTHSFPSYTPRIDALGGFGGEIIFGGRLGLPGPYFTGSSLKSLGRWSPTGVPWIAQQPAIGTDGIDAICTVVPASGYDANGPLQYQWFRNNAPVEDGAEGASPRGGVVSGASTDSLKIDGVQASDAGAYTVTISNGCGQVTSVPVTLDHVDPLCPVDLNASGLVGADDFNILAAHFGIGPGALRVHGDVNADGMINTADFNILAASFGLACDPD